MRTKIWLAAMVHGFIGTIEPAQDGCTAKVAGLADPDRFGNVSRLATAKPFVESRRIDTDQFSAFGKRDERGV